MAEVAAHGPEEVVAEEAVPRPAVVAVVAAEREARAARVVWSPAAAVVMARPEAAGRPVVVPAVRLEAAGRGPVAAVDWAGLGDSLG